MPLLKTGEAAWPRATTSIAVGAGAAWCEGNHDDLVLALRCGERWRPRYNIV